MTFIAIMKATSDDRVAKYQAFETETEANAHIARFTKRFPNAFVTLEPAAPFSHWRIDTVAKTVTVDPPPSPSPLPESELLQALRDMADDLGTQHAAKIIARFGPRPSQGQN